MTAVRPLTAADRAGWEALWNGYLEFYRVELPPEVTEAAWRRLLDPGAGMHGLRAAGDAGEVDGIVHCFFHPVTWAIAHRRYLEDLFAKPAARRTGIGRRLVEAVYARRTRKSPTGLLAYGGRQRDCAAALRSREPSDAAPRRFRRFADRESVPSPRGGGSIPGKAASFRAAAAGVRADDCALRGHRVGDSPVPPARLAIFRPHPVDHGGLRQRFEFRLADRRPFVGRLDLRPGTAPCAGFFTPNATRASSYRSPPGRCRESSRLRWCAERNTHEHATIFVWRRPSCPARRSLSDPGFRTQAQRSARKGCFWRRSAASCRFWFRRAPD